MDSSLATVTLAAWNTAEATVLTLARVALGFGLLMVIALAVALWLGRRDRIRRELAARIADSDTEVLRARVDQRLRQEGLR